MFHIRVSVLAVAVCVIVGAFSMTAFSQELLTQKVISMEMAQTMAQTAILQCRENGYRVECDRARQRRQRQGDHSR